jgi:hypothetical protein
MTPLVTQTIIFEFISIMSHLGLQGIALLLLGEALVTDEVGCLCILFFIFWHCSLCSSVYI